jgi:DNA-binding response OmpR family regulator
MLGSKILIVDDEIEINQLISLYLQKEGFKVSILEHGDQVISFVQAEKPDLIILDILLPGLDGIELCRELRKFTQIPILFVSCKTDDIDIILSLEVGGDDYITKPFSPGQLVARVKANLRRKLLTAKSLEQDQQKIIFPGLEINLSTYQVFLNGKEVSLSAKEFEILVILAQHPHRVFKIDDLYQRIWGSDSFGDTRTLIVHISNLRKKVESDIANPKYILTVRGVGYKFNHTL